MKKLTLIVLALLLATPAYGQMTLREPPPAIDLGSKTEWKYDKATDRYTQTVVAPRAVSRDRFDRQRTRLNEELATLQSLQAKFLTEDEARAVLGIMGATITGPRSIAGTFQWMLEHRISQIIDRIEWMNEAAKEARE